MTRYEVFVVPTDGSGDVKVGEFQYLSEAISHIDGMKSVYVEQPKYNKACVRDTTFGNSVVYEQFWNGVKKNGA